MIMDTVGELLRRWRRRRDLSQLDLAIAADVSARHVSLVETGKSTPSAAMVLRLAEQLDVPLRDRNRLLLVAGFAPRYAERPLDGGGLGVAEDAVRRVLHAHEPYPAMVLDRHWNIVATNRSVGPLFADVAPALLEPPVNLIRLALDPRGLAPALGNLADVREVLRSRITRRLALVPDAELTALYNEVLTPEPEDAAYEATDADVVLPMIFTFGDRQLRLFSTVTTFGSPLDITLDEIVIESYFPADAETAAFLTESPPYQLASATYR